MVVVKLLRFSQRAQDGSWLKATVRADWLQARRVTVLGNARSHIIKDESYKRQQAVTSSPFNATMRLAQGWYLHTSIESRRALAYTWNRPSTALPCNTPYSTCCLGQVFGVPKRAWRGRVSLGATMAKSAVLALLFQNVSFCAPAVQLDAVSMDDEAIVPRLA